MNFILKCVPYANEGIFTFGNARIEVNMVVKGSCLNVAKLSEQVTLPPHAQHLVNLRCLEVNNLSVFLLEAILNTENQRFRVPQTNLSTMGYQYCQFWSFTNEPITLFPGTLIGQCAPVEDILSIAQENDTAGVDRLTETQFQKQT